MTKAEKVKKIAEKTGLSLEQAERVLEENDGDMLEAFIKLNEQRKNESNKEKSTETYQETAQYETDSSNKIAKDYQKYQQEKQSTKKGRIGKVKVLMKKIIKWGCDNKFVIKKNSEKIAEAPVLLMLLLLLVSMWTILIVLILGLFCGLSYSFSGPNLDREEINSAMAKATDVCEDIKDRYHREK